jgi:hypothetical protein
MREGATAGRFKAKNTSYGGVGSRSPAAYPRQSHEVGRRIDFIAGEGGDSGHAFSLAVGD